MPGGLQSACIALVTAAVIEAACPTVHLRGRSGTMVHNGTQAACLFLRRQAITLNLWQLWAAAALEPAPYCLRGRLSPAGCTHCNWLH